MLVTHHNELGISSNDGSYANISDLHSCFWDAVFATFAQFHKYMTSRGHLLLHLLLVPPKPVLSCLLLE